jgi:hypothetical protein
MKGEKMLRNKLLPTLGGTDGVTKPAPWAYDFAHVGLAPGHKLRRYEIQSALGAGGMGEVYRARDTRLDRTVAIKILPAHLSDNPEAKQRFDREARAISSLNHPNICTLYDVGHQHGFATGVSHSGSVLGKLNSHMSMKTIPQMQGRRIRRSAGTSQAQQPGVVRIGS